MPPQQRLRDELLHAILQNAHDLFWEAVLLLENGKWARAHALATFAVEEIGKGWIFQWRYATEGQKAFNVSTDHGAKLTAAREMLAFIRGLREDHVIDTEAWFDEAHGFEAEHDFYTRMTHLYVEVDGGQVVGGSQGVSEEVAQRAVAFAATIVRNGIAVLAPREGDEDEPEEQDVPF